MKFALSGLKGRMGRAILSAVEEDPDTLCLYGFEHRDSDRTPFNGIPLILLEAASFSEIDVVIDFSTPQASLSLLPYLTKNRVPCVIGTTGFSEEEKQTLKHAALETAILHSGNMSLGITLLSSLVKHVAQSLGPEFDIEILERHHRHKIDAPSGTALLLGEQAAQGRGVSLETQGVFVRHGQTGPRREGDIGFCTSRGGSVVGDHTVLFSGPAEEITLSHRAHSRDIFAHGALKAAQWILGKPPGLYTMHDVLGNFSLSRS